MPRHGIHDAGHEVVLLFAHGVEIGSATGENLRSGFGTESTADLLLNLGHAQIALRLVVLPGHGGILQEEQGRLLPIAQPLEEIARLAAFDAPALTWLTRRWWWIDLESGIKGRVIAPSDVIDQPLRNPFSGGMVPLLELLAVEQHPDHALGPALS